MKRQGNIEKNVKGDLQGAHCTGKTGKMGKKIPVRENTGNLEMLPKHRVFGFPTL